MSSTTTVSGGRVPDLVGAASAEKETSAIAIDRIRASMSEWLPPRPRTITGLEPVLEVARVHMSPLKVGPLVALALTVCACNKSQEKPSGVSLTDPSKLSET